MFVDASAFCAVLLREEGYEVFERKLAEGSGLMTSPIGVWETVRGVVRETGVEVAAAQSVVEAYMAETEIRLVQVGGAELELALAAMSRFGKGRHPARLNMGDCFAYACARSHGAPLLFKGDDFTKTDVPAA